MKKLMVFIWVTGCLSSCDNDSNGASTRMDSTIGSADSALKALADSAKLVVDSAVKKADSATHVLVDSVKSKAADLKGRARKVVKD